MIKCRNCSNMAPDLNLPFSHRYPNISFNINLPTNNIYNLYDNVIAATNNRSIRKSVINRNIVVEVVKHYGYMQVFFVVDIYKRKSIFFKLKYLYYCYKNHYKTPLYKAVISLIRTMVLGTR